MDELVVALVFTLASVFSTLVLALFLAAVYCLCFGSRGIQLGDGLPGAFDDSEQFLEEEAAALEVMDDRSRQSYLMAKRWIENNPPNSADTDISLSQFMTIQEKAVAAWEFTFDIMQQSSAFVQNRTEIEFRSSDDICCVQTNLPLPKQKEVYYWEVKVYELAPEARLAVGLTTKPYPVFRLPGMHRYSIAYESSGFKRLNQPFMATPYGRQWQRGDVIGVGYRTRTGTVFFTHNGKKLDEVVHGMRVNLFPTVGSIGPANVYVNLGQAAFVFIQANVKEWGLAPAQGSLAPPPAYGDQDDSLLLESTNIAGPSNRTWGAPAAPPYVRRRSSDEAHQSAASEEDIHTPPGSPPTRFMRRGSVASSESPSPLESHAAERASLERGASRDRASQDESDEQNTLSGEPSREHTEPTAEPNERGGPNDEVAEAAAPEPSGPDGVPSNVARDAPSHERRGTRSSEPSSESSGQPTSESTSESASESTSESTREPSRVIPNGLNSARGEPQGVRKDNSLTGEP